MAGKGRSSSRSAGVAYVDLAVGDSATLVAGVAAAGQSAAEAFMRVFEQSFHPHGVTAQLADELITGASEAARTAVNDINSTLQDAGHIQLSLFDAAPLVEEAKLAGTEAGQGIAEGIKVGDEQAQQSAISLGESLKSTLSSAGNWIKDTFSSIGQSVGNETKSAGGEAKSGILKSLEELKTGIVYSIGGWGIGYSIGNAIFSGFQNAFQMVKSSVIDFNSQEQQAQISLTTMLGSQQKAIAFNEQLKNFAVKTPFQYDQLVPDAQRLMGLGIAAKNVLPTLTAIGDAVSAMGGTPQNLQEMVNAIGEMQAKGQVMQVNLRQLEIRGVKANAILADEYGVTDAQMQKMIRTGKVLASDAIPKLIDGIEHGTKSVHALGGGMALQATTFAGSLSNIHDALQQFASTAFKPVFDQLDTLAVKFSNALLGGGPGLSNISSKISGATSNVISGVTSAGKTAASLGQTALAGTAAPAQQLAQTNLAGLQSVWAQIAPSLPGLAKDFNDIAKALLAVANNVSKVAWSQIKGAIHDLMPAVMGVADGAAKLAKNKTAVDVISGIVAGFLAFKAAMVVQGWMELAAKGIEGITVAMRALAVALGIIDVEESVATGGLNLIIPLVAAVVAAIIYFYNTNKTFKKVMDDTGHFFVWLWKDYIWPALKAISAPLMGFYKTMFDIWKSISPTLLAAFDSINHASEKVVKMFLTWGPKIANAMKTLPILLAGIAGDVVLGFVHGIGGDTAVKMVTDAAHSLAMAIPEPIRKFLGIHSPSKVTHSFGVWVAEGLAKGMEGSSKNVESAATKLANNVSTGLYNSLRHEISQLDSIAKQRDALAKRLTDAKKKLSDAIKLRDDYANTVANNMLGSYNITNGAGSADQIIYNLKDAVASADLFKNLLNSLHSMGLNDIAYKQIVDAGVSGGTAAAQALVNGGPGAIAQVNALQGQLATSAASLGSAASKNLYQAGVDAAQGLVNGIEAQSAALGKAASKLANSLVSAVKRALKIKSPSQVMADEVGAFIPLGVVQGIDAQTPAVDASMQSMVNPALALAPLAAGTAYRTTDPGNFQVRVTIGNEEIKSYVCEVYDERTGQLVRQFRGR